MLMDFALKKSPGFRVTSIVRIGGWKENNLRTEFSELTRWAERNRIRTGRWIFVDAGANNRRWEACLEIKGNATAEGRIRLKTLPATWVARVVFDPDRVSSRVVYHALSDWTRQQRRNHEIRDVTTVREIYSGDPWKDKAAWAKCEVQFVVTLPRANLSRS